MEDFTTHIKTETLERKQIISSNLENRLEEINFNQKLDELASFIYSTVMNRGKATINEDRLLKKLKRLSLMLNILK